MMAEITIMIVVFGVIPVLIGLAVYFGHKWRADLKRAENEIKEAQFREMADRISRKHETKNHVYYSDQCIISAYDEIEKRNRQFCMNHADIRMAYERCQFQGCMQYRPEQDNVVIDIGVAEVEREEPIGLPDNCCGYDGCDCSGGDCGGGE